MYSGANSFRDKKMTGQTLFLKEKWRGRNFFGQKNDGPGLFYRKKWEGSEFSVEKMMGLPLFQEMKMTGLPLFEYKVYAISPPQVPYCSARGTQKQLIFLYKSVLSNAHKCSRGIPLKWRDGKRAHWWYARLAKCAHIFTSNHPNFYQFLSSSIRLIEKSQTYHIGIGSIAWTFPFYRPNGDAYKKSDVSIYMVKTITVFPYKPV